MNRTKWRVENDSSPDYICDLKSKYILEILWPLGLQTFYVNESHPVHRFVPLAVDAYQSQFMYVA